MVDVYHTVAYDASSNERKVISFAHYHKTLGPRNICLKTAVDVFDWSFERAKLRRMLLHLMGSLLVIVRF